MSPSSEGPFFGGLDEAGRGAVLGPLVVAVVVCDDKAADRVEALSPQDSKRYGAGPAARRRRAELAARIRQAAWLVRTAQAPAKVVDTWVRERSLDELERHLARKLLASLPDHVASLVADGHRIFSPLQREFPYLRAENRADRTHVLAAAASIVAKHERDRLLQEILDAYEPLFGPIRGGGYPNAATREFVTAYHRATGSWPPELRRSWNWASLTQLSLFES